MNEMSELLKWRIGWAADPAIDILLDKSKIAQIKIAELDARILDLEKSLEVIKMTKEALKEQYKIR